MALLRRDDWPNRTGTSEMGDLERERRVVGLMQLDMVRLETENERLREENARLRGLVDERVETIRSLLKRPTWPSSWGG